MFELGFGELMVIAIVALVVLGPERLPKAARFTGLWIRRARAHWHSVKSELERELEAEEIKRSLHETEAAVRKTETQLNEEITSLHREAEAIRRDPETGSPSATAAPEEQKPSR
jgi:sec-independent protein translocase protein TatB